MYNNIREPYNKPSHIDGGKCLPVETRRVLLRHPFYDDRDNTFLNLPALDLDSTIHHETALAACYVLSNNARDGYLAEDKSGNKKVEKSDILLKGSSYYFHVPGEPMYGIVGKFEDWEFPHEELPPAWQQLEIPAVNVSELPRSTINAVLSRDISCRISQQHEGTQSAHLVPVAHAKWFNRNGMAIYTIEGSDVGYVSNQSNALLLRADLHIIFDAHRFVFVPKWDATRNSQILLINSFDRNPKSEIVQQYHNVPLQPLSGISVEFLYARFALTVFGLLDRSSFLNREVRRFLRVRNDEGYTTKWFSAEQCRDMIQQSRSRSLSPKKRKPDTLEATDGNAEDSDQDQEQRGRKKHRSMEANYPTPCSSKPSLEDLFRR